MLVGLAACSFQRGGTPVTADEAGPGSDAPHGDAKKDAPMIDARPDAPPSCDMTVCASVGGTCNNGYCAVMLGMGDFTCPTGLTCDITCIGPSGCDSGTINCGDATCIFHCAQMGQCSSATYNCDANARCTFYCKGQDTCASAQFNCGTGGHCDLECCGGGLTCQSIGISGSYTKNTPGTCP